MPKRTFSEEHKNKLRLRSAKIRPWLKGRKFSEETKRKISEANTGKISPLRGTKLSEETKRKMKLAKMGHKPSNWKDGRSLFKSLEYRESIAGRKKPDKCEICERTGRIQFDHCHKTGKFRGWLCAKCNLALGLLDDSQEFLKRMIDYLSKI